MIGRPEPGPEEERVDGPLVSEDHLPGKHPQQVARQERRDQQQEEDVLALRAGQRQVVRERIGEQHDDRRDRQRQLHRLPEQLEVDRAVQEVVPGGQGETVRARVQRVDVEAIRGDDCDRRDGGDPERVVWGEGRGRAEEGRGAE